MAGCAPDGGWAMGGQGKAQAAGARCGVQVRALAGVEGNLGSGGQPDHRPRVVKASRGGPRSDTHRPLQCPYCVDTYWMDTVVTVPSST